MKITGYDTYGLKMSRKIAREVSAKMKGENGDYVRGWRAALREFDMLVKVNLSEFANHPTQPDK